MQPLVLKFGGELLEDPSRLAGVVASVAGIAAAEPQVPLVIVHGGGKEIDAALKVAGIDKRQVDGLRITDDATLDVVVSVLAGAVNTRFVAALTTAGVRAVGLTGADAGLGRSEAAPPHRAVDGRMVDLGRVGIPTAAADVSVVTTLTAAGFVPVVACIGLGADGKLFNVNADTFVRVVGSELPEIKHVVHTNFCDIGWRVDATGRVIIVSVIDNLVKGASGQAIQNMNVMIDAPETAGLL